MIAFVIFAVGIFSFYMYSLNRPNEGIENIESLNYDGELIADSILSTGFPTNWTKDNVITIGLISNEKINQTKLTNFYNLSQSNYSQTQLRFNTAYDYFVAFSDTITINDETITGIGKPGTDLETLQAQATNLIKVTRFTIYNNKPITTYVYVWEEE